ncbi:probable F-box protein At4g22030 [Lotus japonicus]|uniref:probable F-box protein At4g22030 n=1 Tax=Lotus japonicus TaxID=34305 RepID=UPI0025891925|nr:probable F-box protein At4g22030 [Lotus japonicus]
MVLASIQSSVLLSCYQPQPTLSSKRVVNATIHVPKHTRVGFSVPKIHARKLVEELKQKSDTTPLLEKNVSSSSSTNSEASVKLYAILEDVADRIEMHNNIGEQRDNWNTLLLNSINMITLTATTLAGVAATTGAGAPLLALKLSSALLFSAATGLLLVMNKIQPSQLTEEQRNATRLFKQLKSHIETTIAIGNPSEEYIKGAMEKVLALDKAYPLPLLGKMLEKFPAKFEPAVWWPSSQFQKRENKKSQRVKEEGERMGKMNGWNEELEMEMREVVEVVKRKDIEDYDRLGNIALKIHKNLAIAGPLLTGIAAAGSAFVGNGSWAALVPLMAGSLAAAINTFEHGGQVGMVFEMYRTSAGFFNMVETSIESTLEEKDLERRENGELFEMNMALQLGRSVSQLRELASKSASYRMEGVVDIDEFASKLF